LHSLSIVIPAFNEEARLGPTLERLLDYADRHAISAELIVVDDGSTDATAELARQWSARDERVRLVDYYPNQGKGCAVRVGLVAARKEWVLMTDADLSTPIEDLAGLIEAGGDGAIGSRALNRRLVGKHQPLWRELAGRSFNAIMRLATGLPYADTQCGFKLLRGDAAHAIAERLTVDGFGFDVELLFLARRMGYVIAEVPVNWNNAEGTKVSLASGLRAFLDPLRVRWNALRGRYDTRSAQ
jgi:glycosyltransferase involved in cell wall biosynthesis